ncbi:MAG: DNA double-strand break repair nuclease NurA [Candidatus Ranarchaeia archaeon]
MENYLPGMDLDIAFLDGEQSSSIFEILNSLNSKSAINGIENQVRNLLVSVASGGILGNEAGNPFLSLDKAIHRIDFESLKNTGKNRKKRLGEAKTILQGLDNKKIRRLEEQIVFEEEVREPSETLSDYNIVGFDGGSLPIYNYSCSTVYARGGSFGYSQKNGKNRFTFESGINRIWCDLAVNIASKPGIIDEDAKISSIDNSTEDNNELMPLRDRIKRIEGYALALVESTSVISCLKEFSDKIDLVFLDGPQFISQEGFFPSLLRMITLRNLKIPSISVVKNPSGSPVMSACDINYISDTAFFDYLNPGERSPLFLRCEEGAKQIPSQNIKRVFWYYKTKRGFISRYEIPYWCYKQNKHDFSSITVADSELDGGNVSYIIGRADSIVKIPNQMRDYLRSIQKAKFHERDVNFTEPYNQHRWSNI